MKDKGGFAFRLTLKLSAHSQKEDPGSSVILWVWVCRWDMIRAFYKLFEISQKVALKALV